MSDDEQARAIGIHPDVVILARHAPGTGELRVCYANPATHRLLGRSPEELLGKPLRTLLVDESPFSTREQREAFNAEVRRRGILEFPGLAQVRDAEGRRRRLRVRLCWPEGSDTALALAEDVTERGDVEASSGAAERLRMAIEVSGLLSHHVNNALAGALLNVDFIQHRLRGSLDEDTAEALADARSALRAAADVVAALSVSAAVEAEVAESCDLVLALQRAVAAASGDRTPALTLEAPDSPVFVWGAGAQLEVILAGLLPVLTAGPSTRVHASVSRSGSEVTLKLTAEAGAEGWLRALLDPAEPQPASDARSVRLFASVQVLQVVGGRLGLPSWRGEQMHVLVHLRAAPGAVHAPPRATHVLLVSGDGALRASTATLLSDCNVQHTHSIREGIAWLVRPRGVVLCDVDELDMPLHELLALQRMATGGDTQRLILASRAAEWEAGLALPHARIPFDRGELLRLLDIARQDEQA